MKYRPPLEIGVNEDVAYLIGALQGDGTVHEYRNKRGWVSALYASIAVGKKEKHYADVLCRVIKRTFDYECIVAQIRP